MHIEHSGRIQERQQQRLVGNVRDVQIEHLHIDMMTIGRMIDRQNVEACLSEAG